MADFWANQYAKDWFEQAGKTRSFQFSQSTIVETLADLLFGDNSLPPPAWDRFLSEIESGVRLARLELSTFPNEQNLISVCNLETTGAIISVSDISQLGHRRKRLQQLDKLATLGRLAANYAHDFNNYLAIIDRQLELLSLQDPLPEQTQILLSRAQETTRAAAGRSNELLTFSRPRSKRQQSVFISEITDRLKSSTAYMQSEQLTIEIVSELEAVLKCDAIYLHSALINLIVNACDACGGEGQVNVNFSVPSEEMLNDKLPERTPGLTWVKLSVSDTGKGIDPDIQDQVFDPFFTTKQDQGGSGLGLSIVANLIKDSDGTIFVEETSDKGTTISLLLRSCSKPDVINAGKNLSKTNPDNQRILLVEDEFYLAESTRSLLVRKGFQVSLARGYSEAKVLMENEQFDAILSDVMMPDGNGVDLCTESKLRNPLLPFLLISGNIPDSLSQPFKDCGADSVLTKPAPIEMLTKALLRAIHDAQPHQN